MEKKLIIKNSQDSSKHCMVERGGEKSKKVVMLFEFKLKLGNHNI